MEFWSLESLLLGLGAVILAFDQALSNANSIKARFPHFRARRWIKFVPILFWAVAGVVWALRPSEPKIVSTTHSTVSGVDLKRLAELGKAHTAYEYGLLMRPFRDAPVTVKGVVKDVRDEKGGQAGVQLADTIEGYAIGMVFQKDSSVAAFRLQQGDIISAKCKFRSMGGDTMAFVEQCELESSK